jgi:hypothetical protein
MIEHLISKVQNLKPPAFVECASERGQGDQVKKFHARSSVAFFYLVLYLSLIASVIHAEAQQTARVPARLGFLSAL